MFLSLFLICIVAGALLSLVNELTKDPIEQARKQKLENAIALVVPGFDNDPSTEMYKVAVQENDSATIYPAKKEGKLIGYAIETSTMDGFSGEIKIITGLDTSGKIINYSVLSHAETPGLGDKMDSWFKTDKNKQSILGRDLSKGELKVSKKGGDVDAITAATISSVAFLDAVNKTYKTVFGENSDGNTETETDINSGATTDANSGATNAGE